MNSYESIRKDTAMVSKRRWTLLIIIFAVVAVLGQQSSPYILTVFPLTSTSSDSKIWVKWTGISRPSIPVTGPTYNAPDSGTLYFDRSPGGSVVANYHYHVTKFCIDTQSNGTIQVEDNVYLGGIPPTRGIEFRPKDQVGMDAGVFYYMIGFKTSIMGHDTTFYSNELQMIVESPNATTPIGPTGNITQLTPTFSWQTNPGVPYYHVILSDEPIKIDTTGGLNIQGLSIIWQAITPTTQIVYGAPDPSGTITASPPPLSPTQTYSWVVLNNYGNQPAYTSTKVGLPQTFTILGTPLAKPVLISPKQDTLNYQNDSIITFKWTNLDPKANTYQVYIYMSYSSGGTQAKLVVWQNQVTAGAFAGSNGVLDAHDTGLISINARSVLTNNSYSWKVFAIDSKGASTASDTAGFRYSAPAMGTMSIHTMERIITTTQTGAGTVIDTIVSRVPLVQLQVDVLSGSQEAPLLFYTDTAGNLSRDRPAGTYRVTAIKDGFESFVKTIVLDSGKTDDETFFLSRPSATMFGKVNDQAGVGINAAAVVAVSERNDTVVTHTDALGSYSVNCYAADWVLYAQKTGYTTSLPARVSVTAGQSKNMAAIVLAALPLTLSGVVKNGTGDPLLGADVQLILNGQVIAENPSTSQAGTFSFSVSPGTYTLYATKVGFATYSKAINISSSTQQAITMSAGAALINGYVYGKSWIGAKLLYGPITSATVRFTDTTQIGADTFSAISGATYGNFGVSVPGGHVYKMMSNALGYVSHSRYLADTLKGGITISVNDTLGGLGMLSGTVLLSSNRMPVANATVNLITASANQLIASAKSQANGYFEMRNLADGTLLLTTGADGYVTDSIVASDTIYVSSGKTTIEGRTDAESLVVFMSAGTKSIRWVVNAGKDTTATIKIQSPLQKSLSPKDTLKNAGAGTYIVSVDGAADSVIDLSYHSFTVANSETFHWDSVALPVSNATSDTVRIVRDTIRLSMRSTAMLDSAICYFRDISALAFDSAKIRDSSLTYTFAIKGQKDGSNLVYFFRAFRKNDVYGYTQETYLAHIPPDLTKLTKLEMMPSISDTMLLPADYDMAFSVKGYFGSQFSPASLDSNAISWVSSQPSLGFTLSRTKGLTTTVHTPAGAPTGVLKLQAVIDTTVVRIDPQRMTFNGAFVYIKSTGKKVSKIVVQRTDPQALFPISTSSLSQAEFSAQGLDADSNVVTVSPTWSIVPAGAGTINTSGVFKPSKSFVGFVRVFAASGAFSGEYAVVGNVQSQPGLEVQHLVMQSGQPDTVTNLNGCTIILPDSVVPAGKPALIQLLTPTIENERARATGNLTAVGTIFDINELNGVPFQLVAGDSIRMTLSAPQGTNSSNTISLGFWNADSLKWVSLANSAVSSDKKSVSAAIPHFSRWAVLAMSSQLQSSLTVLPNPFSPNRSPSDNQFANTPLRTMFGANAPNGTCISFVADAVDQKIRKVSIRIYTIVNDLVCSVVMQDATKLVKYNFWWDGRTTESDLNWESLPSPTNGDANSRIIPVAGRKMCRNGRYFVVLTIEDYSGKAKSYMKQVILVN
jgi:Carboxypeptidase regulatory-like domain